jgi:hypothetical protein
MKTETRNKILKTLVIVTLLVFVFLAIYLPLKLTEAIDKINSADDLKQIILSGGAFSYLIFCDETIINP